MTYMIHQIEIAKIHIDSTLTIEFKPTDENLMYGLLLDHERIPIPSLYEHAAIVSLKDNNFESTNATNVDWNPDYEFYEWFISNDAVNNRTGRWFLTIISMKATTTSDELNKKKCEDSNMFEKLKIHFLYVNPRTCPRNCRSLGNTPTCNSNHNVNT